MPLRVIIAADDTNLRTWMRELLGGGVQREETMRHSRNIGFGPALSPQEEGDRAVYNRLDVRSAMNMKLWFITGLVALVAFTPLAQGARKKATRRCLPSPCSRCAPSACAGPWPGQPAGP